MQLLLPCIEVKTWDMWQWVVTVVVHVLSFSELVSPWKICKRIFNFSLVTKPFRLRNINFVVCTKHLAMKAKRARIGKSSTHSRPQF
jgi:hypothetical protein